jgi:hypothetical protein
VEDSYIEYCKKDIERHYAEMRIQRDKWIPHCDLWERWDNKETQLKLVMEQLEIINTKNNKAQEDIESLEKALPEMNIFDSGFMDQYRIFTDWIDDCIKESTPEINLSQIDNYIESLNVEIEWSNNS